MGQNLKLSRTNLSQIILKIGFETSQNHFLNIFPKAMQQIWTDEI